MINFATKKAFIRIKINQQINYSFFIVRNIFITFVIKILLSENEIKTIYTSNNCTIGCFNSRLRATMEIKKI